MNLKRKSLILCAAICLLFCLLPMTNFKAAAGNMNIDCIYLGEPDNNAGDSVLVESNGKYLLMDVGSKDSYPYIKKFLQERRVTTLSVYISHTHADHTGGLKDGEGFDKLLGDFTVDHLYLPDKSIGAGMDLSWNHEKFVELYQKHYPNANINSSITYLKAGSTFSFGSVAAKVIGPVGMEGKSPSTYKSQAKGNQKEMENIYLNNCSLVSLLTCGKTTFFTGGDVDADEEEQLVKKYGSSLKADIYKMSHHGYANSNSENILKYIKPTYSFAPSSGDANGFTSPSTTNQRKVYASLLRCSEYGFVGLVGAEKTSLSFHTSNGVTKIYRANNMSQNLTGFVAVAGADGRDVKEDHYYIGADGKPLTGVQSVNGKKYYFGTGGRQEYGIYQKGSYSPWRSYEEPDGKKYRYYDKSTHEMKTGLVKQTKTKIYFCDLDTGFRSYGFQNLKGKTYYFGNAGTMYKDKWLTYKKRRYYFKKNGVMATGWVKNKGTKFYFNEDGTRAEGLTKIGKKYYYMASAGTEIKKNYTVKAGSVTLKFNEKGVLVNPPKLKAAKLTSVTSDGNTITAKWNTVKKGSGYTVYVSKSPKGRFEEMANAKKNKKSATIKGLTTGQYYVKIAAYQKLGKIKFYSKASPVKAVTLQ